MNFNVIYEPTSISNIAYLFQRFLLRVQHDFFLLLIITIALTILLTIFYYSYAMVLIKAEARKLWDKIVYTIRPQRKQPQQSAHQVYQQRRQELKEKRKQMLSEFEDAKDNK